MIPSRARVWIAMGHTDMRRGMQGLSQRIQEDLKRDPHGGDLFDFRGRSGSLVKILWHDGVGLSLCTMLIVGASHIHEPAAVVSREIVQETALVRWPSQRSSGRPLLQADRLGLIPGASVAFSPVSFECA